MVKICFAASSGGHLDEIANLRSLRAGREVFLFTERSEFSVPDFCENVYYVEKIDRKQVSFIFRFIALFFQSYKVLKAEKPDCVITTGALAAFPISLIAKLMKKKLICIESFARIDTASLTGRLLYPFADLFIVQWEDTLKFYPKAVYGGWIY